MSIIILIIKLLMLKYQITLISSIKYNNHKYWIAINFEIIKGAIVHAITHNSGQDHKEEVTG